MRARSEAPWTREEEELLKRRLESGRTERELARLHGRELETIRAMMRKIAPVE
ncbi:hypothetical protein OP10G_2968 [Fimbriimonas ginsengisoli Gsoil 348]|uniref:Uncharacterized protein n=1 Tax=Fimbriimonas ginsengisoli Gsoil 348 TaxID=661478 RepID=A0A068NSB6_FIMGI|nr:hypothetical protein OP10G_2968 [Fimbriimonas ginsengisoli Gsoil 348]